MSRLTLVAEGPALRGYVPECVYHRVDLSDYRDEERRGAVVMHTARLALKYNFSERAAGADLAPLEVWGNEFWRPGP